MEIENIVEICVALDVAILSLAYPIIIDKISNIGDKYSSRYIPTLFENEFPQKQVKLPFIKPLPFIKAIIYGTLISFLCIVISVQPFFGAEYWVIGNSAKILVLSLSIFLSFIFFLWLDKVSLYSGNAVKLTMYIIQKYDRNNNDNEYILKALNELTIYAINNKDEHIQESLLDFYHDLFMKIRRSHDKNKPLIYPIDLYFLIRKLSELSVQSSGSRSLSSLEHNAISGGWILGSSFEALPISGDSYRWLWNNVYIISDTSKYTKLFWANSTQYFQYYLEPIQPDYDFNKSDIPINEIQIKTRHSEMEVFLEFHYAFGGLMLYREQYSTLKYMFTYSQSLPPDYVLLPENMTTIFQWFEHFRNRFKHRGDLIDMKYPFPELDNLGTSIQVNYWICSYLTILFVRQYTLQPQYTYQDLKGLPQLPKDVLELNNWLDTVDYFTYCLKTVLENKDLINHLKFNSIVEKEEANFYQFLENLKLAIQDKIKDEKFNAELSQQKIEQFFSRSSDIILNALEPYKKILKPIDSTYSDSELKVGLNGAKTLISKSSFTENDIPNINYDTFFAGSISQDIIKRLIPNSFFIAKTSSYLFKETDIISALKKILGSINNFVIVGFNLSFHCKEILNDSIYKNSVIELTSTEYRVRNSIFILKKEDLPAIEYRELPESDKLEAKEIIHELKVYASVIDINKEEHSSIKTKWQPNSAIDNLELKIQLTIAFMWVLHWKKSRKIIQLNITTEFREQGIPNNISDIEPL